MSAETRKILGGLEIAGCILIMFFVMMLTGGAMHRPQVDVIGMMGETTPQSAELTAPLTRGAEEERDARAEEMARVAYGTALYNSEEAQRAVMWCIINRCESGIYPNSVEEVCRQPQQWMGYSAENPVMDKLYDMACEVLAAWENGGSRNLPQDCLFLVWNGNDSITFRTKFEGGNEWVVE